MLNITYRAAIVLLILFVLAVAYVAFTYLSLVHNGANVSVELAVRVAMMHLGL